MALYNNNWMEHPWKSINNLTKLNASFARGTTRFLRNLCRYLSVRHPALCDVSIPPLLAAWWWGDRAICLLENCFCVCECFWLLAHRRRWQTGEEGYHTEVLSLVSLIIRRMSSVLFKFYKIRKISANKNVKKHGTWINRCCGKTS